MPAWEWLLDAVVAVLVLLAWYALALIVRRRIIARHGGTFELSYRARSARTGRGWVLGIGRYSGDTLEWFRIFSLAPRPRKAWRRLDLTYDGRRRPLGAESMSLFADHLIVTVQAPEGPIEMAMSEESLYGFASWLESAPPGTDWDQARR